MADRYFVEAPITGELATITGTEAHHLAHVMRAKAGAEVSLFDGSGREFAARVDNVGRSQVELRILSCQSIDRELAIPCTLAAALPKGDRQRWLIEKAVELGVTRFVPLDTQRGVSQPTGSALDRMRRSVIEASKQCGRNRLMEIAEPATLENWLTGSDPTSDKQTLRWLAHPNGQPLANLIDSLHNTQPASIRLAVGPEGGFTDAEVQQAVDHGWQIVSLGKRILRVETAALTLAAAAALCAQCTSTE